MNNNNTQEVNVQARQLDDLSTALINLGVTVVKKNPVISASYVLGILLCLFFTGLSLTNEQTSDFEKDLRRLDYAAVADADYDFRVAEQAYKAKKGWFSCDSMCQDRKIQMEEAFRNLKYLEAENEKKLSNAKSKMGILSEVGVTETRELFWTRFGQGKQFASSRTKWDALFMGIGAMRRDENMISFLLRLLMTTLFNFTIGMFGAVIGFMWTLYSVIQSYQASFIVAFPYFILASLAALSFAMTFVIGIYGAAAGVVYVGAKAMASNLRLQGAGGARQQRVPMGAHYNTRQHYN